MAVLGPVEKAREGLWRDLEEAFGPIEYKGEFKPFLGTGYYEQEFGTHLERGLVAFRGVDGPERLTALKHLSARIEQTWTEGGKRIFNLDIGYMDPDKVVLASFKRGPNKLYLENGVYADMVLRYGKGRFDPLPWTFADFQDDRYQKSLLTIRQKLKSELRKVRSGMPEKPE